VTPAEVSTLPRLIDAAHEAVAHRGAVTRSFDLAGSTIHLVGAGSALIDRMLPAFAHLPDADPAASPSGAHLPDVDPDADPTRAGSPAADLTILVWDTASTGVALPDLGAAGPVVGQPVAPILHDATHSFAFHAYEGAVSHLDRERCLAVYAVEDAVRYPSWERACPLRSLLTWWFLPHRRLVAHGGAVSVGDDAVLLTGVGGSGKSTTALAALAGGFDYLGDDYVLVDLHEPPSARVHSLYGSAKLAPEHLTRFPGLLHPDEDIPRDPPDAKMVGWPIAEHPARARRHASIRAVVLPEVVGAGPSMLERVPTSRALLGLAPSTLFQTAGHHGGAFRLAAEVARAVPAYRLGLGADLGSDGGTVPHLLRQLLDGGVAR
jgi:hypothetical protein